MAFKAATATVARLLSGKVAIVTGASSGLGRATALAFTSHGATVVCADRSPVSRADKERTDELIRQQGGTAVFVQTDVSQADSVRQLVASAAKEFGRVDVMVNNAGIAHEAPDPHPVWETTEEVFDTTWAVNVRGVFLGCKYAGAQMLQQPRLENDHRAGTIINVGSVLGVLGKPGTPAYAAAKGAVIALTRTAAMDFAPHHIHCNSILPGFTRTPMISAMTDDPKIGDYLAGCHPMQRLGESEEIADAAVFLASKLSKGITGVNLSVDGGLHAQLRV